MKIQNESFKRFVQQYRGFSIVLVLEMIFLMVLAILSLKKAVTYELDCDNLIIREPAVVKEGDGSLFITGRNDAEPFSRYIFESSPLDMPHGVYELEVSYNSLLHDIDQGGGSCEERTGIIQLASANHASGYQYNEISLTDGRDTTSDRIWVRSVTGIDDLQVKVCFLGTGDLRVTGIVVRELTAWRWVCFIGWLLAFATVDLLYIYFFTENSYKDKQVAAGLAAAVIFSSLPVFTNFLFRGHDLDFHLARIWSLAEGIKNGHWIVPIQTEMLNGYGYAAPLFYGQLFLYIPAVLYVMAAPLQVCYQVYVFLVNAATCLICYFCIKGLLKDKNLAALGAVLYTLSAYRITNLYVRAAVGEYSAMVFFPLILYGFAVVYMEEGRRVWRGVLPVVIGLAGVIQSHLLSCEMAALFIMALCAIKIKKTLRPERLLALVSAAMLTLLVSLAFIVPFLQSMQMDIAVHHRTDKIQESGIYLMQALGIFMPAAGGEHQGSMYQEMPIAIGFSLVFGLGIFLLCCAGKYDWGIRDDRYLRAGVVCSGFSVAGILFSARFFPWDSLEDVSEGLYHILSVVQFPWRYLSVCTVTCLMAAVIGVKLLGECRGAVYGKAAAGIMILFAVLNIGNFFAEYGYGTQPVYVYGVVGQAGYLGGGEYLLAGTRTSETNWRKVVTDETSVTVAGYDYTDGVTTFWCQNASNGESIVTIPLLNYANYHAYVLDGQAELEIRNGENNCVAVVVPPGYEGTVQVSYKIPLLWKLSYILSAATVISIVAGVVYQRKKC